MYRYIWLVPLLPLAGAAVNGFFGRKFRFSEQLIGGIAVGSVALAFLISVAAVISYGFGSHAQWPNTYVTSQDGAFKFDWIPGGAVLQTQGDEARLSAELDKKVQERLTQMTPEERQQNQAILVGAGITPRSSVLNIEWSYQLDPLSSIFMLI